MKTWSLRSRIGLGSLDQRGKVQLAWGEFRDDPRGIAERDAAARHDDDAIAGLFDQSADQRGTVQHRRLLTGCEHAGNTEADQHFERGGWIGRHIERPVERDRQRTSGFDQLRRERDIHRAIRQQCAYDNAIGALGTRSLDIGQHDLGLVMIEHEVSATRADDDVQADPGDPPRLPYHPTAGSYPALEQVGAEFNPIGPGLQGGPDPGDRIHTDLKLHHAPPDRCPRHTPDRRGSRTPPRIAEKPCRTSIPSRRPRCGS